MEVGEMRKSRHVLSQRQTRTTAARFYKFVSPFSLLHPLSSGSKK